MSLDPHKIRMAAGQGAMTTLAALDNDDTVALFEPAIEHMHALGQSLKDDGLPTLTILQLLVGVAIGAAQLMEGEGRN